MSSGDRLGKLTKREKEVWGLLITGMSNQEIAVVLRISEKTVETHLQHIYTKLGTRGRLEVLLQYYKALVHKSDF